jgi:hypothetical protein
MLLISDAPNTQTQKQEDIVTENPQPNHIDDTEGQAVTWRADAEAAKGDDDTEGHGVRWIADAETAEGDDDTEGHLLRKWAAAEAREGEDDVAGHVQPPPDFEFRNNER